MNKEPREPSELFERSFSSGCGGIRRTCSCGMVCFDNYDEKSGWEEGELEQLRASVTSDPEDFQPMSGTVSTMTIGGGEYVMGCKRCFIPAEVEDWIKRHAEQVADYLTGLARQHRKKADAITPKI